MTAQNQDAAYGPAAHRADNIPDLAVGWSEHNGLMKTLLRWGNYAGLDAFTELDFQLNTGVHKVYEQQNQEGRKQAVFCDGHRWRFETTSRLPHFLFILKWSCFFFPWFFWGSSVIERLDLASSELSTLLSIGVNVGCAFTSALLFGTSKQGYAYWMMATGAATTAAIICWHEGALFGFWSEQTAFWVGMFFFLIACIGSDALLSLYSRFYEHDGSEFNRRTGMLVIARRFRKPFVAPFYEFDSVMHLMVTPHGGHDYALWLYHRYSGTKVCLANRLHSLGLDQANLLAFWDTLQRYMDVTQPLPDMPVLEQSRHLDPVTAAYDTANGRPPRYWRDIKPKAWLRKEGKELQQELAAYPWQQQLCILRQKFDPQLSIENYYRSQEAKGIYATPKRDDFDSIPKR